VIASRDALERAGDESGRWVTLGTVALRGHSAPTAIFEPVRVPEPVA
jgi:class 3 adenylate cyclase